MSTHYLGFYGELTKNIPNISRNTHFNLALTYPTPPDIAICSLKSTEFMSGGFHFNTS